MGSIPHGASPAVALSKSMEKYKRKFFASCFGLVLLVFGSSLAFSQVSVSIDIAPPPLPEYEQPACPDDGYLWSPGYWAYGDDGYFWVPGTWVQPPEVGLYWTPAYWGWNGNAFEFYPGYWGQNVGFYGGIDYGYGYGGNGYDGGHWQGRQFSYNSAANHAGSANNVSFNGGAGGVQVQATAQERQFSSERHIQATSAQRAHVQAASRDRGQLATANGGRPVTAAAATPKSYASGALRHAAAVQPAAVQQSAVKTENVAPEKSSVAPSPERKIETENRPAPSDQGMHATRTDETPAKPHDKASAPHQDQPKPQAKSQPHPDDHAKQGDNSGKPAPH